ncbi:MAG: hypothetical protein C4542_02980 [Dehalococcoidia bacterium]|nr:MAG: hypothetical protein C4542_02980 [Dehalococcoidia bacterium]
MAKALGMVVNAAGFVLDARGDYVTWAGTFIKPTDYEKFFDSADGQRAVEDTAQALWCADNPLHMWDSEGNRETNVIRLLELKNGHWKVAYRAERENKHAAWQAVLIWLSERKGI